MGARCRSCAAAAMSGLRRRPARCVRASRCEPFQQRLKTSPKLPDPSKMARFEGPFTADGQLAGLRRELYGATLPIPRPRPGFPGVRPKSAQDLGPRPGVCDGDELGCRIEHDGETRARRGCEALGQVRGQERVELRLCRGGAHTGTDMTGQPLSRRKKNLRARTSWI